jgi:V/A-type H+-transporting ATPase subunit I
MLLKMARVQIIGTRTHLDATVAALQQLGVLHIQEAKASALKNVAPDETTLRLQQDLGLLAARLDGLLDLLPAVQPSATMPLPERIAHANTHELVEHLRTELGRIAPAIQSLAQRRDELHVEALSLPRYESTLKKLAPLTAELRELQGFDTIALLIDTAYRSVLELLRVELEHVTQSQMEIIVRELDLRTTAALLIYPRAFTEQVQAVLGRENITQVRLPKEVAGRSFRDALTALQQRQFVVREELARADAQMEEYAHQWRGTFVAWRRETKNRLQGLATRAQFGATTYTFVVEGWVPRRELDALRETLAREIGAQVIVNELPVHDVEREHAPVAFSNPVPLQPFEMLVKLMALPRYGAFDPTPLVAVFLPLFFGIMLGDIAYGVLLLLLAWYVRRRYARNEAVRHLAAVLIYGALWAIVFGFLYGEFFGTLGPFVGLKPLLMPREGDKILALFAFTLGLGVVQIVLGLCLGTWEAWRERQRGELCKKVGMLIVLAALFGMISVFANFLPAAFFTPTMVVLLIGVVLLIIPAGPLGLLLGPLEIIETVGNILSYLRLAAIGMASVYLALVANEIGGIFGNVLVGAIVALLLHALNFALGILSPTIQSLRLQYVEFFRQFYEGGGHAYKPFKLE